MVARSKAATGKGRTKTLKLKRETLKDLDVQKAKNVKGGVIIELGVSAVVMACISVLVCPEPPRKTKR